MHHINEKVFYLQPLEELEGSS